MIPNGTNAKKYALTPRSAMTPRLSFISINTPQSALGKSIPRSKNSTHYKSICKFIEKARDTGCHDILHAVQDPVWHYETQPIFPAEEMR